MTASGRVFDLFDEAEFEEYLCELRDLPEVRWYERGRLYTRAAGGGEAGVLRSWRRDLLAGEAG